MHTGGCAQLSSHNSHVDIHSHADQHGYSTYVTINHGATFSKELDHHQWSMGPASAVYAPKPIDGSCPMNYGASMNAIAVQATVASGYTLHSVTTDSKLISV